MLKKLKAFIAKLKVKHRYNVCYRGMEYSYVAAMGRCCGFALEKYREKECLNCPYFCEVSEV